MHVGMDSTFKESKTKEVVFLPPGMDSSMFDTSPVPVLDRYVTYTDKFKYIGSYVTSDLLDTFDVKSQIVQANKTMASMMPHVFHISLICHILNINRMEVQMYSLTNEFLYEDFCINPVANIMASRQLCWLGKIAHIKETQLLRKFTGALNANPILLEDPSKVYGAHT
eukprot:14163289-Ditylum_brightwellii.AAC.1